MFPSLSWLCALRVRWLNKRRGGRAWSLTSRYCIVTALRSQGSFLGVGAPGRAVSKTGMANSVEATRARGASVRLRGRADNIVAFRALAACVVSSMLLAACSAGAPVTERPSALPAAATAADAVALNGAEMWSAEPVPTELTVRVMARDAMFIGPSMGMQIRVYDDGTGELLSEGITIGEVGAKALIMETPRVRGERLSSEQTAVYKTTLALREPTRVRVTASGPIGYPTSANTVSSTQWVLPGRHITGRDGWVLEMGGFAVQIQQPEGPVSGSDGSARVQLRAKVVMMCGCPTEPEGTWDSTGFEIGARIARADGSLLMAAPLQFADEESIYSADLTLPAPGEYLATVFAYDPVTGNTGLDQVPIEVKP